MEQTEESTATVQTNGIDRARAFRDAWVGGAQSEVEGAEAALVNAIQMVLRVTDFGDAQALAGRVARLARAQTRLALAEHGLGQPWQETTRRAGSG